MKIHEEDKSGVVGELLLGLGRGIMRVGSNVLSRGSGLAVKDHVDLLKKSDVVVQKDDVQDEFEFFDG